MYVKALAHAMVVEVILEDQLGRTRNLQSDQMNQIRFDAVELHENAIRTIHIGNVPAKAPTQKVRRWTDKFNPSCDHESWKK